LGRRISATNSSVVVRESLAGEVLDMLCYLAYSAR
jgi:hypothetical protein